MKTIKKFKYDNVTLRIVTDDDGTRKVLAPNDGSLPLRLEYKETIKNIVKKAVIALDNFKSMGADVKKELTKNLYLKK
jgi:hypothetical protein